MLKKRFDNDIFFGYFSYIYFLHLCLTHINRKYYFLNAYYDDDFGLSLNVKYYNQCCL